MNILKMNGRQISDPVRFFRHFSPRSLLLHRELAAGFALQQLRQLSPWHKYNAEVLYQSVFGLACFTSPLTAPEDYLRARGAWVNLSAEEKAAVEDVGKKPGVLHLLRTVWTLSEHTVLPEDEQRALFAALAAGFFLSGQTPVSRPISSEEARAAWRREILPEAEGIPFLTFGSADLFPLPPRREPYPILLSPPGSALRALRQGARLRLLRLDAGEGGATLALYRDRHDNTPRLVSIPAGDYRWLTLAGDEAVYLHPVAVRNGDCVLRRTGDTLLYQAPGVPDRVFPCPPEGVVSLAPEPGGRGWVLLTPSGVDLSGYSMARLYGPRLAAHGVVQAAMEGSDCLLLDWNGTVISSKLDLKAPDCVCLDAAEV